MQAADDEAQVAGCPTSALRVQPPISRVQWWPWALVVLWMAMIFYFSAQPSYTLPNFGEPDTLIKKGAHVTEYAILAWLIQRARGDKRAWWQTWLMAVAYAATDEFHQRFVPGRMPRLTDVMIDSVGAAIGVALALWRG
jgi:VanZ family protein